MKELYICDTPYQIMNVLNMVYHKQDDAERVLFVENNFRTAEHLVKKIEETQMFSSVCLLRKNKNRLISRGIIRYSRAMFDFLTPKLFMKARLKDYPYVAEELLAKKFDTVYIGCFTPTTASMIKLNPNAETVLYDDGTGSYFGNLITRSGGLLNLIFCRVFHVGAYACKPSKLLVNNVSMCKNTTVPKDRIFPLPKLDNDFIDFCKNIFDVDRKKGNSVFWFSQPIIAVSGAEEAREDMRSCLLPYRDKITVRIHPRDLDGEFYRDFTLDYGRDMWELSVLNERENEDSLILIAGYSTAQITPKLLFDMEPVLIFTHHFNRKEKEEQRKDIDQRIEDLRKSYRNPEKIYNPKTAEELSVILQKLIL